MLAESLELEETIKNFESKDAISEGMNIVNEYKKKCEELEGKLLNFQ